MSQTLLKSISVELDGQVCYITVSFLESTKRTCPHIAKIFSFKGRELKSRKDGSHNPGANEIPQQRCLLQAPSIHHISFQ
jgi:hypothetical protein